MALQALFPWESRRLPLANGEVSLGVLANNVELDEGEVMLSSKGGASIVLKNDGRVLINGKAV